MNLKTIPNGIFRTNHVLSSLDLSNNRLTIIPTSLFSFNPKLAFLDLSLNQITILTPEVFLPCPKLTQMILRDNELSQAHSSWFRGFYYKSRYRPYIDLSGNPWSCECSMISFRAWTRRNMWFLTIEGFQDVTCWTPESVRGSSLLALTDKDTTDNTSGRFVLMQIHFISSISLNSRRHFCPGLITSQ